MWTGKILCVEKVSSRSREAVRTFQHHDKDNRSLGFLVRLSGVKAIVRRRKNELQLLGSVSIEGEGAPRTNTTSASLN